MSSIFNARRSRKRFPLAAVHVGARGSALRSARSRSRVSSPARPLARPSVHRDKRCVAIKNLADLETEDGDGQTAARICSTRPPIERHRTVAVAGRTHHERANFLTRNRISGSPRMVLKKVLSILLRLGFKDSLEFGQDGTRRDQSVRFSV